MYRMQQRVLAAKVETTSGTEVTPTVAADAFKAEDIRIKESFAPVDTNEHQDGLDKSDPLYGAGSYEISMRLNLRGSTNPGTAVPVHDPILRSLGFARTDVAAAVTGTAQAGGANSITLAAGASATDNLYRGMPITLTGGTASGEWNFIIAYNGTTKVATVLRTWTVNPDATSAYSIPAGSRYAPASQGLETVTVRVWDKEQASSVNSRLRRAIGCSGTGRISLDPHGLLRLEATLKGVVAAAPANVADPGAVTYAALNPPVYNAAQTVLGVATVKFGTFSFDLGNSIELPDNADATYGFDAAQIVNRNVVGGITPRLELLWVRNLFSDWLTTPTSRGFGVRFGTAAGSRIAVILPSLMVTDLGDSEVRGFTHEDMQFKAQGVDSGAFLYFY